MRRLLPFAVLALFLAGCSDTVPGGKKVVTPTPDKVVGKLPKPTKAPVGDPVAGKAVFTSQGCGTCHTFKPAGTTGTVGPDLDKLPAYAQKANQGTLAQFVSTSITDPSSYVEKGYPQGVMPSTYRSLTPQQLADLVAFLVKGS